MVVVVMTGSLKARAGVLFDHLEAVFFGQDGGPDRLVGWLVRANATDQALISQVYKGRLAYGPEGTRCDYRPPERGAWRRERRWRLEAAWALMVVMQDKPEIVFVDLILGSIALIALLNNLLCGVARWFS